MKNPRSTDQIPIAALSKKRLREMVRMLALKVDVTNLKVRLNTLNRRIHNLSLKIDSMAPVVCPPPAQDPVPMPLALTGDYRKPLTRPPRLDPLRLPPDDWPGRHLYLGNTLARRAAPALAWRILGAWARGAMARLWWCSITEWRLIVRPGWERAWPLRLIWERVDRSQPVAPLPKAPEGNLEIGPG